MRTYKTAGAIARRNFIVLACVAALFTAGATAAADPRAGKPEGERIALWPEGKVPSVEEHQYNEPFIE